MSLALIVWIALGTVGTYGSILVPDYELGSLYSGYQGDYAGKYNNYEPRSYAFEYGVSDPHTGDHKNQWETKDKEGTVRGSYSLLEPDGTTRIVDYIADEHGFRAVVKKVGIHGTSVESHGGAEVAATPQVALAAPVAHIEPHPTIIEGPVAFKSYDGGYEDYVDLKPVVADVYTKPQEYIRAPKAEGIFINVPDQHDFPGPYSRNVLAEGQKIALPQEYLSEHYVPQGQYHLPQENYLLSQEKYVLPEEKYILPQEKYLLPEEKYILPQEKYIFPEEKYNLPQEKYVLPQQYSSAPADHYAAPAAKQIQGYIVPEYKAVPQQFNAPVPAPIPEYKLVNQEYQPPISYQVPQINKEYVLPHQVPLEKEAYSYVQEQRYNTPKIAYVHTPKAQYNLNVDYQ